MPSAPLPTTLLLLALSTPAAGQMLVVRVVDDSTSNPVAGATVDLLTIGAETLSSSATDSTGFVRFTLPSAGEFQLVARAESFLPWPSGTLSLDAGESLEVEIRLGREAIPLEPLVVVTRARRAARLAGYRQRLREGSFSDFVTREEIERRPAATVSDLLRPMSGVHIVDVPRGANPNALSRLIAMRGLRGGQIESAGDMNYCLPGLFLDGVRITQSAEFPIDDLIRADHLEGIEVYSTPGSVPVEYQRVAGDACGAVLFWTRDAEPGQGRSGWWRWALGLGAFGGIFLLMR